MPGHTGYESEESTTPATPATVDAWVSAQVKWCLFGFGMPGEIAREIEGRIETAMRSAMLMPVAAAQAGAK